MALLNEVAGCSISSTAGCRSPLSNHECVHGSERRRLRRVGCADRDADQQERGRAQEATYMRIVHLAAAAAAAAFICSAANAGEIIGSPDQPTVGVGMICNTSDQAKQFLELRAQGIAAKEAMEKVNRAARNPHACGVAAIAFTLDKTVDAKPVNNK